MRIVDGSGLSLLDRLTVRRARRRSSSADVAGPATCGPSSSRALPVAGETGTLVHRMRMAAGPRPRAREDGHDDDASALSGYVSDRYVFSILQNGHPVRRRWTPSESQDRFAQVLARAQ